MKSLVMWERNLKMWT